MTNCKRTVLALLALSALTVCVNAEDVFTNSTKSTDIKPVPATNGVPKALKQADVASKTAKFDSVAKTSDVYKTALDAHALDAAAKAVDKDGAFKGKVTKVFEARDGSMAIVNFDPDYQTALTAVLRKTNFDKLPALTALVGKEVVVTGKFIDFHGRAEILLTNAAQVKLVQ